MIEFTKAHEGVTQLEDHSFNPNFTIRGTCYRFWQSMLNSMDEGALRMKRSL
jgi:hypothetical protein